MEHRRTLRRGWRPRALWPGLVPRCIGRSGFCGAASSEALRPREPCGSASRASRWTRVRPAWTSPRCQRTGRHGRGCRRARLLHVRLLLRVPDGVHSAERQRQPQDPACGDRAAAISQASRFSQVCRVWAPMYRQRTAASPEQGLGADPTADKVAYEVSCRAGRTIWRTTTTGVRSSSSGIRKGPRC